MDYSTLLFKRNRQISILFICGTMIHLLLLTVIPLEYKVVTPYFAIFYCVFLLILCYAKIEDRIIMWLTTIGINVYVFHVNIDTPAFIHIVFFVLPFFIGVMYQSLKVNITLFIMTLVEILFLFYVWKNTYSAPLKLNDHHALFILFLFIGVITFLQSINMGKMWTSIHIQKTAMEQAIHSKDDDLQKSISQGVSYKIKTEQMLIETEKLKIAGEIAAGVAHEIRNPMTVISGYIQMMNNDQSNPYKEYTKIIEPELQRIDMIISEFLVLAKPHVKNMKETNIHPLLHDVLTLFRPEMKLREIIINVDWKAKKTAIFSEENQMKQLFINLFKNAMEAVEKNGVITLLVDNSTTLDEIVIVISDNGVGINEEVLKRIFEPFFTTKVNGTGLGMMISHKIVNEHGGTITIDSTEGVGTDVSIRIPLINH